MTKRDPSALPFKKVDPKMVEHPLERRCFVEAPLNYAHPDGPKIPVFDRLIPAYGSRHDDPSHPVINMENPGIDADAIALGFSSDST